MGGICMLICMKSLQMFPQWQYGPQTGLIIRITWGAFRKYRCLNQPILRHRNLCLWNKCIFRWLWLLARLRTTILRPIPHFTLTISVPALFQRFSFSISSFSCFLYVLNCIWSRQMFLSLVYKGVHLAMWRYYSSSSKTFAIMGDSILYCISKSLNVLKWPHQRIDSSIYA